MQTELHSTDAALAQTDVVPYLDPEGFATLLEQTRGLAMVDFTADWCPPCRRLAPHIDTLARDLAGRLRIAKVDVDDHPELAARFNVMSLPTLLFFRDGQLVDRLVGGLPPVDLRARALELGA